VPDDPARLIAWLVTDEAAWITGQVINTEGGFRRWGSADRCFALQFAAILLLQPAPGSSVSCLSRCPGAAA
jgi:hypothetical protein